MDHEPRENPSDVIVEGSVTASRSVLRAAAATADGFKAGLTEQQEAFVYAFLENGGNASDAALSAGYAFGSYGIRTLAKKKVQEEIARRVKLQAGSALAVALAGLFRIIESPGSDDRAVVAAALGLMDRFGMAPPRGPAVAVQVNNIGSNEAQSILAEVVARRMQRLGSTSKAIEAA